jgi:hypothetical protein
MTLSGHAAGLETGSAKGGAMLVVFQFGLYLVQTLLIGAAGLAAFTSLQADHGFTAAGAVALEIPWLLALCLLGNLLEARSWPRQSWPHFLSVGLIGFATWPVLRGLQLGLSMDNGAAYILFNVLFAVGWAAHWGLRRIHRTQLRLTPQ